MPLTGKDREVEERFESEYGPERGKQVFYSSINAGKVRNIPEARRMAKKRKKHRRSRKRKS